MTQRRPPLRMTSTDCVERGFKLFQFAVDCDANCLERLGRRMLLLADA